MLAATISPAMRSTTDGSKPKFCPSEVPDNASPDIFSITRFHFAFAGVVSHSSSLEFLFLFLLLFFSEDEDEAEASSLPFLPLLFPFLFEEEEEEDDIIDADELVAVKATPRLVLLSLLFLLLLHLTFNFARRSFVSNALPPPRPTARGVLKALDVDDDDDEEQPPLPLKKDDDDDDVFFFFPAK